MENTYTERDVNNFLDGMRFARRIGMQTARGEVSGAAIQREITILSMHLDVAKSKGRLPENVIELYPGAASRETADDVLADLGKGFPQGNESPHTRNLRTGQLLFAACLVLFFIFVGGWIYDGAQKRVDLATQEWSGDYYPPTEQ